MDKIKYIKVCDCNTSEILIELTAIEKTVCLYCSECKKPMKLEIYEGK